MGFWCFSFFFRTETTTGRNKQLYVGATIRHCFSTWCTKEKHDEVVHRRTAKRPKNHKTELYTCKAPEKKKHSERYSTLWLYMKATTGGNKWIFSPQKDSRSLSFKPVGETLEKRMLTSLCFQHYLSHIQLQKRIWLSLKVHNSWLQKKVWEHAVPGLPSVNETSEAEHSKHHSALSAPCKRAQKEKQAEICS